MKSVLFVTNAGPSIGGGHLSRCQALEAAFENEGVVCEWVLNNEARDLADNFELFGVNYVSDPFDKACASDIDSLVRRVDLIVVDTYRADSSFYNRLSAAVSGRIMSILDSPCDYAENLSSYVLDYNLEASSRSYGFGSYPSTHYMIGSAYALMRKDIRTASVSDGDKTVVISGAFDVAGAGLDTATWHRASWGDFLIICGPFVSDEYEHKVRKAAGKGVKVLRAPKNLPQIMADAKHIICTASVTMHEALALRKKTSVFAAVPGQLEGARFLGRTNGGYDLGMWSDVTPDKLELAMAFKPDEDVLANLVNVDGATHCAREILARWDVTNEQ